MNKEEQIYLDTLKEIVEYGTNSLDRTGTGTKFLFSKKFDYDISNGKIPIWTTRKIPWRNQVWELIWFIRGETNIKFLKDRNVNIWDHWSDDQGFIGPTYGQQLRAWNYGGGWPIDQLENLIRDLKSKPESRRHIITLWNPGEFEGMERTFLPCCHSNHIQIVVEEGKYLNYQMVQRSADMPLGYCPWQHALFANIIGTLTGLQPKRMSVIVSNAHVYNNQFDAVYQQISRTPVEFPRLKINKVLNSIKDVEESVLEDYELVGYEPQSFIKYPISI